MLLAMLQAGEAQVLMTFPPGSFSGSFQHAIHALQLGPSCALTPPNRCGNSPVLLILAWVMDESKGNAAFRSVQTRTLSLGHYTFLDLNSM